MYDWRLVRHLSDWVILCECGWVGYYFGQVGGALLWVGRGALENILGGWG